MEIVLLILFAVGIGLALALKQKGGLTRNENKNEFFPLRSHDSLNYDRNEDMEDDGLESEETGNGDDGDTGDGEGL